MVPSESRGPGQRTRNVRVSRAVRRFFRAIWCHELDGQPADAGVRHSDAIALKDYSLMAFAGLWERWKDRVRGDALETYTIITTDPN